MINFSPVTNLTSHLIPHHQTVILRKGLTFILTSTSSSTTTTNILTHAFKELARSMRLLTFFKSSRLKGQFCKKLSAPSTFEPPRAPDNIEEFVRICKSQAMSNLNSPEEHFKRNFRKSYRRNLNLLLSNSAITVQFADKNLGPVILDADWLDIEALRQLRDATTYRRCAETDFAVHARNILNFISERHNQFASFLEKRELEGLIEKTKAAVKARRIPHFKLMPKIHKFKTLADITKWSLTGRPLIAAHSCPTAYLSIWLDSILQPYVDKADNVLKDSKDLVRFFHDFVPDEEYVLGVGDVCSLYPSIPTDVGVQLVYEYLLRHGMNAQLALLVKDALFVVLNNNFFRFKDTFWLQIMGTAMGTHCGPSYANLFLLALEATPRFLNVRDTLLFFKRLIDDILMIARTKAMITKAFEMYNSLNEHINVTWEIGSVVDYLNLTIIANPPHQRLSHRTFAKPFNKFYYLAFSSAHPAHTKKAFIKGLIIALIINSSCFKFYLEDLSLCYDRLRARGYPASLLDPIFTDVSYTSRETRLAPTAKADAHGLTFFSVPYNISLAKLGLHKIFARNWHLVKESAAGEHFRRPPMISWSKTRTVADIINAAYRMPNDDTL